MEYALSYKTKLINMLYSNVLRDTVCLYKNAVSYLINIVNLNWDAISTYDGKFKKTYVENLIHTTKDNIASYDFDIKFHKFPSYFRRSAIADAIGIVSSYKSNLDNYNKERYDVISNGKKFNKKSPKLSLKHYKCPALYKGNMYNRLSENTAKIKVFYKNDWVWHTINLRNQDVKYINKHCFNLKETSPLLIKKGRSYYLQFSFTSKVQFIDKPLEEQRVLAIDLGINTSAVCSLMTYDGTVLKRKFINQNREKDLQSHVINRLKLKQKQGGRKSKNKSLWSKINGLNTHILNNTVYEIIEFAKINNTDIIVFEYLDFKGKKIKGKNNLSTRVNLWLKRKIQSKVKEKAHTLGIRVRRVCAKNTSRLAYDGSGQVIRNKHNVSLCIFTSGKIYNCDLNASYNIGARYFIKEIQKTTDVKRWSQVLTKVSELCARTECTLSTLISLVAVI